MNIFTEEKRHAAKDNSHRALCGASGNSMRRVTMYGGVTCIRCLKILDAKNKKTTAR